jgi:hypothetical protein
MEDVTFDKLHIAYHGPALQDGHMQMLALSVGLRGQALYGESVTIKVEVDPEFESGSLIIPVHILSDAVRVAEGFLTGPAITALVNLITLLGFFGFSGVTLYALFKRLKGRRIEKPEDVPRDMKIDISIELLIRVYNDAEVQENLRKTLAPLHLDGVEEFQTRRQGEVIQTVSKEDLKEADEAELEDLTKNEEIELDIEKAAWRRNLAWHFNDGKTSFDAKIEDKNFWKRIEQGEAFADGDRLKVHLETTARRTSHGTLKVERRIPTVIDVEHVRQRQGKLFGDGQHE